MDYLAYAQVNGSDKNIEDNFETFQKHLCRYLLDYTKEMANKEPGVLETYRAILHRGLNIREAAG